MPDIYLYGKTLDVPPRSRDPLAHIVTERFNEAIRWQETELVGDKPLRVVLRECYDQFNGTLSPTDREIADEIGVDAYVNLTAMKCGVVQSYLVETLVNGRDLPWKVSPTPVPTLSENGRIEALQSLRNEIYTNGFRGNLEELVRNTKITILRREYEHAKDAAENMQRLMTDQCLEGGWVESMYGFVTDFCVYPFAVLMGPFPVRKPRMVWAGDRLTTKYETFYEFKNISPWDFWYSPDSPDTQRGTGVFVRQRWTRQQLLDAAKMPSYIKKNIIKVLETIEDRDRSSFDFHWLSENPDQMDNSLALWADCSATIDVLTHWGYFSGKELRDYGISGVEDNQFYNAMVTIIDEYTIQAVIPPNPNIDLRPVHTASFYKTHDRIPSYSIPQRIRDIERCYLTVLRYMIMNAASVSGPIVEADYSRLSKYMSDDDIAKLIPNTVYLADSALGSNSNPALRFYSVPDVMAGYMQILEYFMDLVDRVTNIPAALHGIAQGTGVNRTFRGAAMLQGNAVKAIQAAVGNIDHFVFGPLGTQLYNYNMLYHDDESVKGDCKVVAQGALGLMQEEIDRQNSYEILQLTASAGQQLAQMPNGMRIMAWALNNVLKNMGVPKELLSDDTSGMSSVPGPNGTTPSPTEQATGLVGGGTEANAVPSDMTNGG